VATFSTPDGQLGIKCAAYTGVAATLIPFARTIHGLLDMHFKGESGAWSALRPLSAARAAVLRERFRNVAIVLIDEISMVGPAMLGFVDQRLRQIMDNDLSFGGLGVILCGDFFQIEPVLPPTTLVQAILAHAGLRTKPISGMRGDTPTSRGAALFADFQCHELVQQMRVAADDEHAALLAALRTYAPGRPVTQAIVDYLTARVLTAEDVRRNPAWITAPVIVTSNAERLMFNQELAVRAAVLAGLPVIRWYYPHGEDAELDAALAVGGGDYDSDGDGDARVRAPELAFLFVAGAPAFLGYNANPGKGLANGTPVTLHSITLSPSMDAAERAAFALALAAA
jgi:hypothetical protein